MRSVLSEGTLLDSVKEFLTRSAKRSKNSGYLKGSISRYSKDLIMTFPVLCDSSIPLDTAMMISKANERNVADMLQLLFASMNLEAFKGENGADLIARFYNGLDPNMDINELIDLLDTIAGGSPMTPGAKFEAAQAVKEMMLTLKNQKSFPIDNFSEKSLNEYIARQTYNNEVVVSEAGSSRANDPYDTLRGNANNKPSDNIAIQRAIDQRDENYRKAQLDKEKQMDQKQKDLINLNQNRLTASDVRKANEIQPLLMTINYNYMVGGHVEDKKTFLAGIKSRLIPVEAMDIVERFAAKKRTELNLKNLIRATTGEIRFVKDFLLCIDQAKLDAKNAAKSGPMSNVWHILEKRGAKNNFNKIRSKGNDAASITTVVLSQESVNYMKTAYGFDLENISSIKMIMDTFNLLAIFIADEATESIKFIYDGNNEFETLAYASLGRELSERDYKKTVNLMNQIGR